MVNPTTSSFLQSVPVSVTTNPDTRPVSIRSGTENEIDQINNTPKARRLYNAKLVGGAIGAAIPLAVALTGIFKAKNRWKEAKKLRSILWAGAAAIGASLTVKCAKAGADISKALTIFVSTRGKAKQRRIMQINSQKINISKAVSFGTTCPDYEARMIAASIPKKPGPIKDMPVGESLLKRLLRKLFGYEKPVKKSGLDKLGIGIIRKA